MHGYMNQEALEKTIITGQMHYFSRSRKVIWHKGATSGFYQNVDELMIDDDQDTIWAKVKVMGGASCHVGYEAVFIEKLFLDEEKVAT